MSYYYCNKECQVNHWSKHKHGCSALKDKYDVFQGKKRSGEKEEEEEKGKTACDLLGSISIVNW